jgi:hypothetical protein
VGLNHVEKKNITKLNAKRLPEIDFFQKRD